MNSAPHRLRWGGSSRLPPSSKAAKCYGVLSRRACSVRAMGLNYKDAGVDIDAGNELVRRIQRLNPSIGGFSGMVPFGTSRVFSFLNL